MKILKKIFLLPTAEEMALLELEEAKRELLKAQSALDYAANIAAYHQDRIGRLTVYLKNAHGKGAQGE